MSGPAKMSHNRTRKAAYAAQADKGSRNENSIGEKPIIGRLVMVDATKPCRACEGSRTDEDGNACRKCDGTGTVVARDINGQARQVQIIVHDGDATPAAVAAGTSKREVADAGKRRRQEAAWARCKYAAQGHKIESKANCQSCGCPATEAALDG